MINLYLRYTRIKMCLKSSVKRVVFIKESVYSKRLICKQKNNIIRYLAIIIIVSYS